MENTNQGNNATKVAAVAAGTGLAISALKIALPTTLITVTWFLIGFCFARAFGKKLDQTLKNQEQFKKLNPLIQYMISCLLDFFHHFWLGLLIMIRCDPGKILIVLGEPVSPYFFGLGIFIDDIPDIPDRFKGYFKYLIGS